MTETTTKRWIKIMHASDGWIDALRWIGDELPDEALEDAADKLADQTVGRLEDEGIETGWAWEQSVGVGVLVQGGDEASKRRFDEILDEERERLRPTLERLLAEANI
jgi:hypothetical protein